jgi:hypothetical protein
MDNIYKSQKSRGGKIFTPGGGDSGSLGSSDLSRVLPRQLSTGSTRGVQKVGYGNVNIDGSNNRITIGDTNGGTIGMGSIPNVTAQIGFFATDTDSSLLFKIVNGTLYFYDKDTSVNYMQIGVLPDGSTGMAVAKSGYSVGDAIT